MDGAITIYGGVGEGRAGKHVKGLRRRRRRSDLRVIQGVSCVGNCKRYATDGSGQFWAVLESARCELLVSWGFDGGVVGDRVGQRRGRRVRGGAISSVRDGQQRRWEFYEQFTKKCRVFRYFLYIKFAKMLRQLRTYL